MGRALIVIGLVLVAAGVLVMLGERLPIKLGRLPGDIVINGKNSTFFFPLMTCLLLSLLFSLVSWIVSKR